MNNRYSNHRSGPPGRRFHRRNERRRNDRGDGRPNSKGPSEAERRFFSKVSIDPQPRIRLESGSSEWTARAVDLLCPIGRGQRGLIVSPPKSGKTTFLKQICQAITSAEPAMKVYCLLVDERPEEVTDFRRSVTADVWYSSSDEAYGHHIDTANRLMKKAIEEADQGADVMILLDSLTRLARVHNSQVRGVGRTLSGGVDSEGLLIPRRIFGTARKIEGGGSLGILATILVETGSRMDDVIFQEFKGTGNMELVLSREIAEQRIFPAINIRETGTRREERLLSEEELKGTRLLRQALASMSPVQAAQALQELLQKTTSNQQILTSL